MSKDLPPFLKRSARIRSLELPALEKHILHSLNSRADKYGCAFPSIATLELDTSLSRSTLIKHLASLRKRGLVLCDRFGSRRHRNVYTLSLFHEDSLVPAVPNTQLHKSGSRTLNSSSGSPTSPADELVPVRLRYLSSLEEESFKRSLEELHVHFHDEDEDILNRWLDVLDELEAALPLQILSTWFINLIPFSFDNSNLFLAAPSKFNSDFINTKYTDVLEELNLIVSFNPEVCHVSHL